MLGVARRPTNLLYHSTYTVVKKKLIYSEKISYLAKTKYDTFNNLSIEKGVAMCYY